MSRQRVTPGAILKVAHDQFGFESLRPGQEAAIEALLEGHDTLVVQPTGSGKSAIYQIAGVLLEGPTVVVSPLIALQKDQVDWIQHATSLGAEAINSTKGDAEIGDTIGRVRDGEVRYVFLAPEQLRKSETLEALRNARISLFVVDEAHCISEWGHDFRPDYQGLGHAVEALGHPRVLGLTATASREVRDEIVDRLQLRRPRVFVRGFDRPNIYLRVDHLKTEDEKRDALVHRVIWANKPGIVYAGTRKAAEEIVRSLSEEGIEAVYYHAGLSRKERELIQDSFMSGGADVIVATNAFGMGVDKPDVRFVYHFDAPDSLDSYYQEIGRAGRDGQKSEALLFYRHQNIGAQSYKTGEGNIRPTELENLTSSIAEEAGPVAPGEIASQTGLSVRKITAAIHRLEDVGAIETLADGEVVLTEAVDVSEAVEAVAQAQDEHRQTKRERLRQIQEYAEATVCRRQALLRHFEEDIERPCGFCDNCEVFDDQAGEVPGGVRREVV